MSKVRLSPGKKLFERGQLPKQAQQGVSTLIDFVIKEQIAPAIFLERANARKVQLAGVARGFYKAMLDTVVSAAANPQYPAQFDTAPPKRIGNTNHVGARRFARRPSISVTLHPAGINPEGFAKPINYLGSAVPLNAPRTVSIPAQGAGAITVKWKLLRADYFHRHPTSSVFWRKTGEGVRGLPDKKIGGLASFYLEQVGAVKDGVLKRGKALKIQGFQKQSSASLTPQYDPVTTSLKTSIRVSYPNLGPQWDFLRKAFVDPAFTGPPALPSRLDSGFRLVAAERLRPLMVPLAKEIGRQYRNYLNALAK